MGPAKNPILALSMGFIVFVGAVTRGRATHPKSDEITTRKQNRNPRASDHGSVTFKDKNTDDYTAIFSAKI